MTKKILFFSLPFFSLLFPAAIEIKKDNNFENKSNLITKKTNYLKNYRNTSKRKIENFFNKERNSVNWAFEKYFEVFKNPSIISFNVKNQNIVDVKNDKNCVVSLNLKDDGTVYFDKQIYNKMNYISSEINNFSPNKNFLSYSFYNGIFNSFNNEYIFNGIGEKDNKDIVTFKGVIWNNNLVKNYRETVIGNLNDRTKMSASTKAVLSIVAIFVVYFVVTIISIACGLYFAIAIAGEEAAGAAEGIAGAAGAEGGAAGAAGAEAGAAGADGLGGELAGSEIFNQV